MNIGFDLKVKRYSECKYFRDPNFGCRIYKTSRVHTRRPNIKTMDIFVKSMSALTFRYLYSLEPLTP